MKTETNNSKKSESDLEAIIEQGIEYLKKEERAGKKFVDFVISENQKSSTESKQRHDKVEVAFKNFSLSTFPKKFRDELNYCTDPEDIPKIQPKIFVKNLENLVDSKKEFSLVLDLSDEEISELNNEKQDSETKRNLYRKKIQERIHKYRVGYDYHTIQPLNVLTKNTLDLDKILDFFQVNPDTQHSEVIT